MSGNVSVGPRTVALVGPYTSGKTTLLESMLFASGAITRKGRVPDKNTIGDSAQEARERQMSVEVNPATFSFNGTRINVLDCPGSVEFAQEHGGIVPGGEPEERKTSQDRSRQVKTRQGSPSSLWVVSGFPCLE